MSFAAIADWDALLTVVWASLAAGVGVTAAYGLVILGTTRAVEFAAVGALGIATVFAAIVFGIVVLSE